MQSASKHNLLIRKISRIEMRGPAPQINRSGLAPSRIFFWIFVISSMASETKDKPPTQDKPSETVLRIKENTYLWHICDRE